MGTQRGKIIGVLPNWFIGIVVPVQYIAVRLALAALVSPVKNIIFVTVHFFTFLVPIAQQPGQPGVLGRLSLCLWRPHWMKKAWTIL
jgi:hypothetical protein